MPHPIFSHTRLCIFHCYASAALNSLVSKHYRNITGILSKIEEKEINNLKNMGGITILVFAALALIGMAGRGAEVGRIEHHLS